MPGYKESPGKKFSSRSENILDKDGPSDQLRAVIKTLGYENRRDLILAGYDWGASICLRMAANLPRLFSKVIAFHPSMGNSKEVKDEIAKIVCPTLLIWIPSDMFHPLKQWKSVTPVFKKLTLELVKIHPWNQDCASGAYKKFSNQICMPMVKFLLGRDPTQSLLNVEKAKEV